MFKGLRRKSSEKTAINSFFIKNGAPVLEHAIRTVNGDCNPIRSYSVEELTAATSNFQWEIDNNWPNYNLYKGIHRGREIAVKRFGLHLSNKDDTVDEIGNEIAIASRMSSHKNSLKLLGICLYTELPMLIYEFPENGKLESYIYNGDNDNKRQLSWRQKLRISIGMADGIAYLHHGIGKTFIHRHIKPSKFFLDGNLNPKQSDFQLALAIPEGKFQVDVREIIGTFGYIAPEVALLGCYVEKSDVFSFGVLLSQVVSGKRIGELGLRQQDDHWSSILREIEMENCNERIQIAEYVKLVRKCVKENPDDRPNMVQVSQTLRLINTM